MTPPDGLVRLDAHSSGLRLPGLIAYGGFGLPLAFVALPIYVVLPDWYSQRFGLPLGLIGGLLLAARLLDALADPLIGLWLDRRRNGFRQAILLAMPQLAGGFAALFHPPALPGKALAGWMLLTLLLTYGGFSLASIAYQAWGAGLARTAAGRARVTATREGFGLLGVVLAAVLPQQVGMTVVSALLAGLLATTGLLLLIMTPAGPAPAPHRPGTASGLLAPLRHAEFRFLLAVFMLNGIASAVPATLVLFFVRDALGLAAWSGVFLAVYFLAGVAAMPLWIGFAARWGLVRSWLAGMALAVLVFAWVLALPGTAPDIALPAFAVLSVLSGMALGADLVAPAALLAGLIQRATPGTLGEGACFGLWHLATKLNLALAAGLVLPLLGALGYVPSQGSVPATGTGGLVLAYGLLPCLLKLGAAALLWRGGKRLHGE